MPYTAKRGSIEGPEYRMKRPGNSHQHSYKKRPTMLQYTNQWSSSKMTAVLRHSSIHKPSSAHCYV